MHPATGIESGLPTSRVPSRCSASSRGEGRSASDTTVVQSKLPTLICRVLFSEVRGPLSWLIRALRSQRFAP